jgi:hypothetical protein
MLWTLNHVLLTAGLFTCGIVATAGVLRQTANLPEFLAVPFMCTGALLLVLGLSWPLYRLVHLRPLGLPRCPHCHKLHANYHVPAAAWPRAVLVCVSCGKPTRLCLTWRKPVDHNTDMPSLYLRWPQFLGLWRLALAGQGR